MKRQRGRGRKPGGGGGGNHGNRPLESNGPDVKIRGTAAQIYEKYSQYARDAQSAGDRVKYENLLQHAEHYYRIMVATMPRERLFQQQGEGGVAPQGGQGFQQPGEGQSQPVEGGMPAGEAADSMKVMDDQSGDDDGEDDDDRDSDRDRDDSERDGDRDRDSDQAAASGGDGDRDRQGRRRRRGRRRHHDQQASNQNNVGNSDGDRDRDHDRDRDQPRSALDSLARRQGAIAGG